MERGMTADQIVSAIRRRKALVGAVALGVFALGAATVASLPSVYKATSVVHVEQQHMDKELVQTTVSENLEQRLLSVRQELMGRPVLEKVIRQLDLYPKTLAKRGVDAAIDQMRTDMDVKAAGEAAFELTYSSSKPATAAKVANLLPQIYAEDTAKLRQAQAERATALFASEIDQLKKSVNEWETKIAQFKVEHLGELPEQLEVNMRNLERVVTEMNGKSEALRAAEAHRSDLARSHYGQDTEAGRLKAAEDTLVQQLADGRASWTEDHPEIQRMEAELKTLRAKRIAAEGGMSVEKEERSRASQMVSQYQRDLDALQKQADTYQKHLAAAPRWATELGALEREYDIAKTKYQSVVSRKVEAEIAQELEAKNASSLFNVISPATVPSAPAKPDRLTGLLISFLAALALSVLTAVVLEMRDDSIRDQSEIKGRLPLPVLAVVPQLNARTERRVLLPATPTLTGAPSTLDSAAKTLS